MEMLSSRMMSWDEEEMAARSQRRAAKVCQGLMVETKRVGGDGGLCCLERIERADNPGRSSVPLKFAAGDSGGVCPISDQLDRDTCRTELLARLNRMY